MILLDPNDISFPDPALYNPEEGLMAIGGDLSPERLYFAYQTGLFPWYNEGEEILWWCPDPRFVMFPEEVYISKSMRKILTKEEFKFTQNKCFQEVMTACQQTRRNNQDGTWINNDLIKSFVTLHQHGIAHSFEVWKDNLLVGGFYGIKLGRIFCGESMFSKVSNASKVALHHLVTHLQENKYLLLDGQVYNEHLDRLGFIEIYRDDFLEILRIAQAKK